MIECDGAVKQNALHYASVGNEGEEGENFVNGVMVLKCVFALVKREKVFIEIRKIFETFAQAECHHKHRQQKHCHCAGVVQRTGHIVMAAVARWHHKFFAMAYWGYCAVGSMVVTEPFCITGFECVLHTIGSGDAVGR